jgi:hypothetical protein
MSGAMVSIVRYSLAAVDWAASVPGCSVAAWVRPTLGNIAIAAPVLLLSQGASDTAERFSLWIQDTGELRGTAQPTDGQGTVNLVTSQIPDGEWVHAALVADFAGDEFRIYIDGELHNSSAPGWDAITSATPSQLGAINGPPEENLTGEFDVAGLRYWPRALSTAEISCVASPRSRAVAPHFFPFQPQIADFDNELRDFGPAAAAPWLRTGLTTVASASQLARS